MNRRLAKEIRALWLPWAIALGAGGLMAIRTGLGPAIRDELGIESGFHQWIMFALQAAPAVFFASLALLAALSYGTEFQQRTLPLILSQPLARSRMWREKALAVFGCVAAAVVAYGLGVLFLRGFLSLPSLLRSAQESSSIEPALLRGTFLLATACSAGFWTLVARSTIGGMVLSAGSQCVLVLAVTDILARIYGPDLDFYNSKNIGALVGSGILYSAVFLWLGWRKFARLQLRFPLGGSGFAGTESFAGLKWEFDWLRCRPAGGVRNLVRKEVRLNKALFLVAIVFSICWLLALALLFLLPGRREMLLMIFNGLSAIYFPLLFLLAGCMSLGEEKSLGLNASQLTLPVSTRIQWLVKLMVGLLLGIALGIVLPLLLAWLTAPRAEVGLVYLMQRNEGGIAVLLIGGGIIFLIAFWASSLLTNTVAAALATVIALAVLGCCAALASTWAWLIGGFGTGLFSLLVAHFQLPPDYFWRADWGWFNLLTFSALALLLLGQSLVQFRRAQPQRYVLLRYSIIAVLVCFCCILGLVTLNESAHQVETGELKLELQNALLSLPPANVEPTPEAPRVVTFKELEDTGKLSPMTRTWLRNTTISFQEVPSARLLWRHYYEVNMVFPKRRQYSFAFDVPRESTQ